MQQNYRYNEKTFFNPVKKTIYKSFARANLRTFKAKF